MESERQYKKSISRVSQQSNTRSFIIDNRSQSADQAQLIDSIQKKENKTGIPVQLRTSGYIFGTKINLESGQKNTSRPTSVLQMVAQLYSERYEELYFESKQLFSEVNNADMESVFKCMLKLDAYRKELIQLNDDQDRQNIAELGQDLQQKIKQLAAILSSFPIAKLILYDDWDNTELVELIGRQLWVITKKQWDILCNCIPDKMTKFALIKLRGEKYDKQKDKITSYAEWPEIQLEVQNGFKWGVESEGGGGNIQVKLKSSYRGSDLDKKNNLIGVLNYLKRTPLVISNYGSLTIDNVMDKVNSLLSGKAVNFPIEIASKPNKILAFTSWAELQQLDSKNRVNKWPNVKKSDSNELIIDNSNNTPVALSKFNKYFITLSVTDMKQNANIQHITLSGRQENRLGMAKELSDISDSIIIGSTTSKAYLSMKPKTSLELLRHKSMNAKDVKTMEFYAHEVREKLRSNMSPQELKFADELLHAIIVPTSGAPREIGGYLLTTPMTNVFPVIPLGGGGITVLRENRNALADIRMGVKI